MYIQFPNRDAVTKENIENIVLEGFTACFMNWPEGNSTRTTCGRIRDVGTVPRSEQHTDDTLPAGYVEPPENARMLRQ